MVEPRPQTLPVVKRLEEAEAGRWDAYVDGCPEATFFHRAGWRTVIERSFGHPTYFLYVERGGSIEGVLPLGHVRSRLFGNALISVPFGVYGGIAASTAEAHQLLDTAACDLARDLAVDYLELRYLRRTDSGRPGKALYATFRRPLVADPEQLLATIPRKQRAVIRKASQAGFEVHRDDDLDDFCRIYATSVRNLGTPVFPKTYFANLKAVFGDSCEILTVRREGLALASVMSFYFRDQVLPYYGGGVAAARVHKANDYLYWSLMRLAAEQGSRLFDFGRSKRGTGAYRYKQHWGFVPEPLGYEYELVRAGQVPDLNPLNPKYRFFIAAWKRLPLAVSRVIGPWLARNLA